MTTNPPVNQAPTSYHKPRPRREPVLVLLHGDGWVEAYAERHVDVRMQVVPYAATPQGERLAEEYVDQTLPHRYRDVYWPGMRRAADMVRVILPIDIAQRNWELERLQALDGLLDEGREGRRIWIV
jgi:hypothetical protein